MRYSLDFFCKNRGKKTINIKKDCKHWTIHILEIFECPLITPYLMVSSNYPQLTIEIIHYIKEQKIQAWYAKTWFPWGRKFLTKLIKKETPTQVFFCNFCWIFKNTFFMEFQWQKTSRQLLLFFFIHFTSFLKPVFFLFLDMLYHGFRKWCISLI